MESNLINNATMPEELGEPIQQRVVKEELGQQPVPLDEQTQNNEKVKPEGRQAEAGRSLDEGSPQPQIEPGCTPAEPEMTVDETTLDGMTFEELEELYRKLDGLRQKLQANDELRVTADKQEKEKEKHRLELELHCRTLEERSLLTYLRNPDEKCNCSGSKPDLATGHVMATRTQAFFSSVLLHDYSLELTHETQLLSSPDMGVHSKAEVEFNVHNLLLSVLVALDLDRLYAIKRKFIEPACDMVIVQKLDLFPIGFVKVMLPDAKKIDERVFGAFKDEKMTHPGDGYVAGQMFDLLVGLKKIGPKNPVALLTNGNKWQLVSVDKVLPEGNLQTQVSELPKPLKRLLPSASRRRWSKRKGKGPATKLLGTVKGIAKPVVHVVDKWKKGNREIFVSDSVNVIDGGDHDGIKLGDFLAKVLRLMISSSHDRFDSLPHGIPLRLLDYTKDTGATACDVVLVLDLPRADESKFPSDEATRFYLLEPLRTMPGTSCYKALAEDGSTCVIKVFYGTDGITWDTDIYDSILSLARKVLRSWDKICGDGRCRIREVGSSGEIHLMVPYLEFVGGRTQAGSRVNLGKSTKSLCIASKQSEQQISGDDDTLPSTPDKSG
jgi:hypothetical protein